MGVAVARDACVFLRGDVAGRSRVLSISPSMSPERRSWDGERFGPPGLHFGNRMWRQCWGWCSLTRLPPHSNIDSCLVQQRSPPRCVRLINKRVFAVLMFLFRFLPVFWAVSSTKADFFHFDSISNVSTYYFNYLYCNIWEGDCQPNQEDATQQGRLLCLWIIVCQR